MASKNHLRFHCCRICISLHVELMLVQFCCFPDNFTNDKFLLNFNVLSKTLARLQLLNIMKLFYYPFDRSSSMVKFDIIAHTSLTCSYFSRKYSQVLMCLIGVPNLKEIYIAMRRQLKIFLKQCKEQYGKKIVQILGTHISQTTELIYFKSDMQLASYKVSWNIFVQLNVMKGAKQLI